MSKYSATSTDRYVRGLKACATFFLAASAVTATAAAVVNGVSPSEDVVVLSKVFGCLSVALAPLTLVTAANQVEALKGNGHSAPRRFMNCIFNPKSYMGGAPVMK